jgi:luciferase family oxidoreductase group 1
VGRFTEPVLSVLDLAIVSGGATERQALEGSVALARCAESLGFERVWYAEHHNMGSIASSATSVLIAHVAANTDTIRLGSGGIMLPNHSPLVIAEQFGTLATLHPGRIDLGLGRAPGTDQVTVRALRRDPAAAEHFPQDVLELQGYLRGESIVAGVKAVPGAGTNVPIYILGSSLFGAQLAAELGLPYGFASHFAPEALTRAVALYRERFKPSEQFDEPYVVAGVNVIAAETDDEAETERQAVLHARVARFLAGDRELTEDQVDQLVASPQGRQVAAMMTYTAVGSPASVRRYLEEFTRHADADELMLSPASRRPEERIRTLELVAGSY